MGCTTSSSKIETEVINTRVPSNAPLQPAPSPSHSEVNTPSSSAILKTERDKQSTERISWRKGDLIGTGANGRVYLGLEEDTGAIIAVKEILFTNNQSVSA